MVGCPLGSPVPDRVLLRLAFDGARFHGTQRQPGVPTVNQAVLDALSKANLLAEEPRLRAQGRVDSGTSARDHPIALDVTGDLATIARAIAGGTTGIVPFAGARVAEGFDPRIATRSRTYRYHLPRTRELDVDALIATWCTFEGCHDFAAFARVEPGKRPQRTTRTLTRCRAWRRSDGLVLEASGPSFLRHQVRRMVGATLLTARGELDPSVIQHALEGDPLDTHAKAPAAGLTLWRVALSADWRPLPEAERIARDRLTGDRDRLVQRLAAVEAAMRPRAGP